MEDMEMQMEVSIDVLYVLLIIPSLVLLSFF